MKVYGSPVSTCTRKVLAMLHEKGRQAEFVHVDLGKQEQKSPEHLARHPFGVVPVLEDDGFMLYESRAILRYLERKFPEPSLTPSSAQGYGRMEQWLSIEQSYFSGPALGVVRELLWKRSPHATPDLHKVDEMRVKLVQAFRVMDKHLLGSAYLAGHTYSLADLSFAPYMDYLAMTHVGDSLITKHSLVASWWKRISARPSWLAASGRGAAQATAG
jgi:glutathione S-transferase